MKFTRIPTDTFRQLQLNAGVILKDFDPATGEAEDTDLVCATSGGVTFSATPTFTDFGEDIDNCPKNMMELKKLESWEIKMSGTALTADGADIKTLFGAANFAPSTGKITPRNDVEGNDFVDELWWVGDYSDKNGETNGGFIAICMKNVLNTSGFSITSADKAKGTFPFEYTAHYSNTDPDSVPCEIYVKAGTAEPTS